MKDESIRDWLADRRSVGTPDGNVSTGTVTPSVVECPDCGEPLAVRFCFERLLGEIVVADQEWTEDAPHHWIRPWKRTDAGRVARHAGYQKRTPFEPRTLHTLGATLRDASYSSDHPGIRELGPEDILVCRCGAEVPLCP